MIKLLHGDCLEQMKTLPDNSVDSIVTDPPYGLSFMGKAWDYDVPKSDVWREALRVLKPGGHLLAFFGTRTYHRGVVNIEDAGFEIRDQIGWCYGSGFPKSHNLKGDWQGWGSALKPAWESIVVARKPLEKGLTIAENVIKWGTGALNIDECRIEGAIPIVPQPKFNTTGTIYNMKTGDGRNGEMSRSEGRWPANILFDEEAAAVLDMQSGNLVSKWGKPSDTLTTGDTFKVTTKDRAKKQAAFVGDSGGASRFFYVAKASKSERNKGLDRPSSHPTVKPIKLMQYLIKLVTPPNGTVLDPFMGSGSTGVASRELGFNFIGCEMNEEYFEIAQKRING